MLEIYPSVVQPGDQYRLWRYDRDVTSGDPLAGPAIAEGVLTPIMYFAR
ncbi:MAG: hypothetical protein JWR24_2507 [Actinoallomurus sp.]|nr:hypothetical protein [Actinoallomurus sp.]